MSHAQSPFERASALVGVHRGAVSAEGAVTRAKVIRGGASASRAATSPLNLQSPVL
jgi:hypothetical protein